MSEQRRTKIARDVGAPAAGRRFVRAALDDYPQARDAAELVVSELLTNAVVHETSSHDPLCVGIEIRRDAARLSVDLAPNQMVTLQAQRGGAGGGFGLGIVRTLCRRWGIDREAGPTLWCEIELGAPAPCV